MNVRPLARALGAAFVATAVLVVLHRIGGGQLSLPPLRSLEEAGRWFREREPEVAVFAGLRLVAIVAAWYLLAVLGLRLAADLFGSGGLMRAVDAITVPVVRRTVAGVLGAGLVSHAAGAAPAAADESTAPTERLEVMTERLVVVDDPVAAEGEATMRLLSTPKARDVAPDAPQPAGVETWVIQPGDHLWAIAEDHLADVLGRTPATPEITRYWETIIERNRTRLVDPNNPDLVVPAQEFVLPPPSG